MAELPIIVSVERLADDDPSATVESNISIVNGMFERHFKASELHPDALRSYYLDYFAAQVDNGGFSQFVYNSR